MPSLPPGWGRTGRQGDEKIGKVNLSGGDADDRHKDVVYQGIDDVAEGSADNDTDSHIHDIAAHDEFFEFFCDLAHKEFLLIVVSSAHGLLRALHSRNPPRLFAYRDAYAPLFMLISGRGLQDHISPLVQAQV